MAKIPTILEAGRADGKLITSNSIFDENKGIFQSELNDIQDTLNSDNPNKPLSANQGKILKELLDNKVIEAGSVPIDTEPIEGNITHLVNSDGLAKEFNKCNTAIITTDRIKGGAVTSEKIATSAFDPTLSVSGKIAPADIVGGKFSDLNTGTDNILGILGTPISVTTIEAYSDVELPYTIPKGVKIISTSGGLINGRTHKNDATYQSIEAEIITDRPIRFIRSDSVRTIKIQIEGLYHKTDIPENSITSKKLKDKAVTCSKTDFEIISEIDSETDYRNTISELYVVAPIRQGTILCTKFYNKYLFLRYKEKNNNAAKDSWNVAVNISNWVNYKTYQLVCTTACPSLGVNLGDIIGYIIFKDIDSFRNQSQEGPGNSIYYDWVHNISNCPVILTNLCDIDKIADNAVTTSKIADNAVTTSKIAKNQITIDYLDQESCIDEFYLIKDFSPTYKYILKQYEGNIYFRTKSQSDFVSATNITNIEDGKVVELKVSSSSNENYPVGTLLGYLITKNIEKWKTIQDATSNNTIISTSGVIDIRNSPKIAAYLFQKRNPISIGDNAVTTQSIVNKAVTLEKMADEALPNEVGIEILLPNEIIAVEEDTLQIFHRSVIRCVNPYVYHIEVICSVGKKYPRYYTYTPDSSHIGNTYSLTYKVKRNDGTIIAQKQTTLRVISKLTSPLSNKNLLVIGASTYANGSIAGEVKRRLTQSTGSGTPYNPTGLGLSNITFIGRKNIPTYDVNIEATGGYGWKVYSTNVLKSYRFYISGVNQLNIGDTYTITNHSQSQTYYLSVKEINVTEGDGNILCEVYGGAIYSEPIPSSGTIVIRTGTGDSSIHYSSVVIESGNPFWNDNNNTVDFQNYANIYCGGASIDAIIAQMGINDVSNITIEDIFTNYIKPFIRKYHLDYPSGKFFIGGLQLPSCIGGMGANYGASSYNYFSTANKYWDFLKAVYSLVSEEEFSSYVCFIATTEEFDCENCYPIQNVNVNNRVNISEPLGTNGVHPTEDGGKMLSDAIYRSISYFL